LTLASALVLTGAGVSVAQARTRLAGQSRQPGS
jgi:hypothetical protein